MGQDLEKALMTLERGRPGREDLNEALNLIDRGFDRESGTLSSLMILFPGDKDLGPNDPPEDRSPRIGERIGREGRPRRLAGVMRSGGRSSRARAAAGLTPEEKEAASLVPSRVPGFPGPLSDDYVAVRLEALGIAYRNPLSEAAGFEVGAFIDGRRSVLEIRNAVSAECGPVRLDDVRDYIEKLVRAGVVVLK